MERLMKNAADLLEFCETQSWRAFTAAIRERAEQRPRK